MSTGPSFSLTWGIGRGSRWALAAGAIASTALALAGCGGSDDQDGDGDDDGGSGGSNATGGSGGTGAVGKGGGSGKGGAPSIGDLPPATEAAWTIFVYGHGDHNLSNSLLVDVREMAEADLGTDNAVNVVVLTDWNSSQAIAGTDPPEAFPDGVQLFRIAGRGRDLEVVAENPELNLDDPAVLSAVVSGVFTAYPARRRGVVLWDHGGSWSGGFGSDTDNGTVETPTGMAAEAIPPAVLAGLEDAGVTGTPPLEFFGFDTCLMAGAEVIYPFRELAKVYLANAEIDYGAGWDYTATLSYIAAHPDDTAIALATAEVGQWDAHHRAASPNDTLLRSHTAFDLSKVGAFVEDTAAFTAALSDSNSFSPIDLGRSGFFALPPYASQFENAGSSLPGLRDAGQVLSALALTSSDPSVASAAGAARDSLDALIIQSSQGSIRTASEQSGLHVELSLASQITPAHRQAYGQRASEWAGASGWESVLTTLVNGADDVAPTFSHAVPNGGGASQAAPPILELSTPDADAARGVVYLGSQLDAQTIVLLGLVGSGTLESDTDYEFLWDGSVATFPDGQPAMLDIWLDTGSDTSEPVLMVPGLLGGASDEPLVTYLVFTPSEGAATTAVVSFGDVASTLSLSEITDAAPDATFTPLYFQIDTATGESTLVSGDAMGLPTNGTYVFEQSFVPAGSYYYFTSLTDVWGNTGTELDSVELLEPLGP